MLKSRGAARDAIYAEAGMATIETLPILVIFMVILSYSIGAFGAIHTAILHSIAARTYALETFRHRTDLGYLRDTGGTKYYYGRIGARVHAVGVPESETANKDFRATERAIAKGLSGPEIQGRNDSTHNNSDSGVKGIDESKRASVGVNPIWIMVQYGICLNAGCGG